MPSTVSATPSSLRPIRRAEELARLRSGAADSGGGRRGEPVTSGDGAGASGVAGGARHAAADADRAALRRKEEAATVQEERLRAEALAQAQLAATADDLRKMIRENQVRPRRRSPQLHLHLHLHHLHLASTAASPPPLSPAPPALGAERGAAARALWRSSQLAHELQHGASRRAAAPIRTHRAETPLADLDPTPPTAPRRRRLPAAGEGEGRREGGAPRPAVSCDEAKALQASSRHCCWAPPPPPQPPPPRVPAPGVLHPRADVICSRRGSSAIASARSERSSRPSTPPARRTPRNCAPRAPSS